MSACSLLSMANPSLPSQVSRCSCFSILSSRMPSSAALKFYKGDNPSNNLRNASPLLTCKLLNVAKKLSFRDPSTNKVGKLYFRNSHHVVLDKWWRYKHGDPIPKVRFQQIRTKKNRPDFSSVKIQSVYELEPDDSGRCKDEPAAIHRRTVYDHAAWIHHTSSLRHAKTILSMAKSKVVIALGPPVSVLTLVAIALALYNDIVTHLFPSWFPLIHMNQLPLQLLAPALALLLVFRTNASYARFDEARRALGSNVSRTRDIARQALCYIRHPSDSKNLKKLLRHCIAFNFCMKSHMLKEDTVKKDLSYLVEEDEMEALLAAPHKPIFCLMVMSEIIQACDISSEEQAHMSKNITQFFDNLGTCERIFKTPIPLSYTRLTSRLLVIWHVALPLVLWDSCQWAVVPATALSAAVLFCIEEVGVLIEEPFQIFPLEMMCITAGKNVENLVRIHENYLHGQENFLENLDEENDCEKAA